MPENSIEGIFEAIKRLNVLIIGDAMIDRYSYGSVDRVSPEAPVPVVRVEKEEQRPGGAANAAQNIRAMGATPILCSVIGTDQNGQFLKELLESQGLSTQGIIRSNDRITTIKHRVLSGSQHLIRIDTEDRHPLTQLDKEALLTNALNLLDTADVIIFEDYDKGVLDHEVISGVLKKARGKGIPSVVDPKVANFFGYQGCTLFKPNLIELSESLGKKIPAVIEDLDQSIQHIQDRIQADNYLVTLSKKGVYWNDGNKSSIFPAHERAISDISGAGDTVVSLAALAIGLKLPLPFVAEFANLGGGIVCEYQGVVPVDQHRLLEESLKSSYLGSLTGD